MGSATLLNHGFKVYNKDGFSLLELLVVTAIISMLGSLIFVQVGSARQRARDAEREKEIKTLQDALAIYAVSRRFYPVYSGVLTGTDPASTALINDGAIQSIPLDPLGVGVYKYTYDSPNGSTYTITYYLEGDSIPGKSAGTQTASP